MLDLNDRIGKVDANSKSPTFSLWAQFQKKKSLGRKIKPRGLWQRRGFRRHVELEKQAKHGV